VIALQTIPGYVIPAGCALMLRNCGPGGVSKNGFVWPLTPGEIATCPDWSPVAECGHGLHGWLWGEGDHNAAGVPIEQVDAVWLVVEIALDSIVSLDRKIKVPSGRVVASGPRHEVCAWLGVMAPGRAIIAGTATAGDAGTATAGVRGTATAGYAGTATAGVRGTVSVRWWDGRSNRYRIVSADVGDNGIRPNTPYHCIDGKLVEGKHP
jgi:hypothetical protein